MILCLNCEEYFCEKDIDEHSKHCYKKIKEPD